MMNKSKNKKVYIIQVFGWILFFIGFLMLVSVFGAENGIQQAVIATVATAVFAAAIFLVVASIATES